MVSSFRVLCALALTPSLMTLATSCSANSRIEQAQNPSVAAQSQSSVQTVNIPHTPVKWQSIGNCWAYAALGWVESMMLRGTNEPLPNFSESYVTYRHYEVQLNGLRSNEVQTGGSFEEATELIIRYGLMIESDFAPDEANLSRSERQKRATAIINESLKTGPLAKSRSFETIRAELDRAFGVDMNALEGKIIKASSLKVPMGGGATAPLSEVMPSWREVVWPVSYTKYPNEPQVGEKPFAQWDGNVSELQRRALRRVMRAMNAGYPVVMNWFVDFNGMTPLGTFELSAVQKALTQGRQGYHSTVLEDYLAKGVDPVTQLPFETPEGEVSNELKSKAVEFGSLTAFIVKNSWGGAERQDRSSYQRDGEKGYHKLSADYLFAFLPQFNEKSGRFEGYTTGVNSFVVPPGF
ncbi:hypothetical protein EBU99_08525 [bacterium]|nr:hypothetical protein [bacterium]